MKCRERFQKACRCEPVDRPPVWVMRQAGRHLPEYRALKETYSFHELVQTPELAVEVTLQPVERYGMDAAIVFSDILVIPEALGQPYHFRDVGGIGMEYRIETRAQVDKLDPSGIRDKLGYVGETLQLLRRKLGDDHALIGFGGSPWTLATYMVEGGSSRDYRLAKELYLTDRQTFDAMMSTITEALIEYFQMQIEAGVDAIQIFDSWGGVLTPPAYREASAKWMGQIVEAIDGEVPVIVFSKGALGQLDSILETKPDVVGVDWTVDMRAIRDATGPNVGVQGNMDPVFMNTTPELVRAEMMRILESMRGTTGHIVNLGHGISPHARIECMQALVDTVQEFA